MALQRRQVLFLLKFGVLLLLFYVIVSLRPVDAHVILPFTRGITEVSGAILRLLGQPVLVTGTVISGSFAVDIHNGCNGIEAIVFVCAAMFAFDAPIGKRLIGAMLAALILQTLNIIRIVSLYLIGLRWPKVFETAHLAIWQTLMFAAAIFIFMAWTSRVAPRNAVASA
jgi:exosortase H (IPTLxxWG-CTERM-specific)